MVLTHAEYCLTILSYCLHKLHAYLDFDLFLLRQNNVLGTFQSIQRSFDNALYLLIATSSCRTSAIYNPNS